MPAILDLRRTARPWLAAQAALTLGLLFASTAHALAVPALHGHVNDGARVLDAERAQRLEQRLMDYEQQSGHQFALLTVPSLENDSLEEFSIRVAESWKLGTKGKDDGLVLLIVPGEHKVRIEVGYGLEGLIPDAIASRVIREVIAPAFQRSDYAGGIDAAFDALMKAAGDPNIARAAHLRHAARGQGSALWALLPLFLPLFLFMVLGPLFGGRRRMGMGPVYWGGGGGGGGWGGGGGGDGGGFGGGGGGFGGGGASGSW